MSDPKKSVPPDPATAARVAQDLLAQIHKDFVVEKKEIPTSDANKGAQLGQDLLAQFAHDFGEKKRAEEAARLQAFGQQLLGAVARDFGSVRPGAGPAAPPVPSIPAAPAVPSVTSSPGSVQAPSSSGQVPAPSSPGSISAPPGYAPPPPRPVTLAPPPSAELVKAEEELAKIEAAPLAQDEAAEVEAMQGRGALGFLRKLFKR